MAFKISDIRAAAVIGAGHGIGFEIVRALLKQNEHIKIYATFRNKSKAAGLLALAEEFTFERLQVFEIDPTKEEDLAKLKQQIDPSVKLNFLLVSVGLLHDDQGMQPERSLRDLTLENMSKSFQVNAFATPLVAKHFIQHINKSGPAAFVALSAKVGSIGDNRLGGWYSYRASKAALNMFIKTISIEFTRLRFDQMSVIAMHPGTTETDLSQPFLANVKYRVLPTPEAAENILRVIEQSHPEGTGLFKDWDGSNLPW